MEAVNTTTPKGYCRNRAGPRQAPNSRLRCWQGAKSSGEGSVGVAKRNLPAACLSAWSLSSVLQAVGDVKARLGLTSRPKCAGVRVSVRQHFGTDDDEVSKLISASVTAQIPNPNEVGFNSKGNEVARSPTISSHATFSVGESSELPRTSDLSKA